MMAHPFTPARLYVFRAIGLVLLVNYIWNSLLKIAPGNYSALLWICPLTLLVTAMGFLLNKPSLIVFGFIGSLYMMVIWMLDLGSMVVFHKFLLYGMTKSFVFLPWSERVPSLFHLFLPWITFACIRQQDIMQYAWVKNSIFFILITLLSLLIGPDLNINFVYSFSGIPYFIVFEILVMPTIFILSQQLLSWFKQNHTLFSLNNRIKRILKR